MVIFTMKRNFTVRQLKSTIAVAHTKGKDMRIMNNLIAVVGLGLIGGSISMALRGFEDYTVVGVDDQIARGQVGVAQELLTVILFAQILIPSSVQLS